jgi:hypothetical protein
MANRSDLLSKEARFRYFNVRTKEERDAIMLEEGFDPDYFVIAPEYESLWPEFRATVLIEPPPVELRKAWKAFLAERMSM